MITIRELINKIKWDKNENPADYAVYYEDRVQKKLVKLLFLSIRKIQDNFMVVEKDDEEVYIPFHRIRVMKKKGRTIWQR